MATTGAIEAFYKRKYNKVLDLSEQYFQHVAKSTTLAYPQTYKYENQSSFWNGGSTESATKKAMEFAIPLERYARYLSASQMATLRDQISGTGALAWKKNLALNTVTQEQVDNFEYSSLYISQEARGKSKYGVKEAVFLDFSKTRDTNFMERTIYSNQKLLLVLFFLGNIIQQQEFMSTTPLPQAMVTPCWLLATIGLSNTFC